MSEQAGRTVIDSLEFARSGQSLRGSVPVASLERLHDALCDTAGAVDYLLRGGCDARQRLTLALEVTGVLHLRCQRCLGPFDYRLRLANTLLLANPGEVDSGALDAEESESIEPSGELDVASLIEDEIILGLPYAPRHAEESCRAGREAPGAASPFAVLAELKRNSH
jgi:uncharacterized protein